MNANNMVDVVREDDVLRLTLNRPDAANALHPDAVETLLEQFSPPVDVRLAVIRGNGRHFCAGFDLSDLDDLSDGDLLWRFVRIELLLQRVQHAPFPVAAFAHGRVIGAGAELFAACTHRIASPGTTFRMPGWNFDLALGTRRLTRLVGSDNARDVLMNGPNVDHDRALALGLATDIVDQDDWMDHEANLRRQATNLSPSATRQLLDLTQADTRTEDMAALVESAARPGLRDRISAFRRQALR